MLVASQELLPELREISHWSFITSVKPNFVLQSRGLLCGLQRSEPNSLMVYSFGDMAPSPESCRPVILTGSGFTQTKTPRSEALFVPHLPLCLEEILWDLNWGLLVPHWASQVALVGKNPPVNARDIRDTTWVSSLGWEDLLEEGVATHSSIHTWRIPWTEEPGGLYSSWGCKSWTWLSDYTTTTNKSFIWVFSPTYWVSVVQWLDNDGPIELC